MTIDVLIVGSGPAGVSAAWPLVRAGVNVVMIDAGAGEDLDPVNAPASLGDLRSSQDTWPFRFGRELESLSAARNADASPKLSTPAALRLTRTFAERTAITASGLRCLGAQASGGLSNIWGAFACAFDSEDLSGTVLAAGVLDASYRAVAERIGISGVDDDVGRHLGIDLPLQSPIELDDGPADLIARYARHKSIVNAGGLELGRARNAVLSEDMDTRRACARTGLCLWGCPRKAIYNARYELAKLGALPNFSLIPGKRAVSVRHDELGASVTTVDATGVGEEIRAGKAILCAGTFESTRLALDMLSYRRPVPLLCNPVSALALLQPRRLGVSAAGEGFALAQLAYRLSLPDNTYAFGAIYTSEGLPMADLARSIPLSRPVAAKLAAMLSPSMLVATCYLDGALSQCTAELRGDALHLEGGHLHAAEVAAAMAKRRLAKLFRRLGCFLLPGSGGLSTPGSDAHYAGTLPHRLTQPADGLPWTDKGGRLAASANVYVADGSVLPRLPAKHCTLTIMANADRIGRGIAERTT